MKPHITKALEDQMARHDCYKSNMSESEQDDLRRNAYLDMFWNIQDQNLQHYPDDRYWNIRRSMLARFGHAVPDEKALAIVARYAPLIEIGAGRGYWAGLLQERGVDVIAFDAFPRWGDQEHPYKTGVRYSPVCKGSCDMLAVYPRRNLLMIWPPPDDASFASECLKSFKGEFVVFVGEGFGGCTGDNEFFGSLYADFVEDIDHGIPQWDSLHDRLSVWRRKKK